jgi:hypothetical protein
LTNNLIWFVPALLIGYVTVVPYLTYGTSTIQIVTPRAFRGKMVSVFLLLVTLFGAGLGPSVVAAITDFYFHDEAKVGESLGLSIALFTTISVTLLHLGRRSLRAAVDEAARVDRIDCPKGGDTRPAVDASGRPGEPR